MPSHSAPPDRVSHACTPIYIWSRRGRLDHPATAGISRLEIVSLNILPRSTSYCRPILRREVLRSEAQQWLSASHLEHRVSYGVMARTTTRDIHLAKDHEHELTGRVEFTSMLQGYEHVTAYCYNCEWCGVLCMLY